MYRRLFSGKPLSQVISDVSPAKPLFNIATPNGGHSDLAFRIVQECQYRLSQRRRIVRRNEGNSGPLSKRRGDGRDRAGNHGLSTGQVIKDFHWRGFAPVPSERSDTERHGTDPRGNFLIGDPTGPGKTGIQRQTIRLLFQFRRGFSITDQEQVH